MFTTYRGTVGGNKSPKKRRKTEKFTHKTTPTLSNQVTNHKDESKATLVRGNQSLPPMKDWTVNL